jgi:ribosomal protein L20
MRRYVNPAISDVDRLALAELAKADRAAFAEVITEYVDPVYLTLDIAGAFMNTRQMSFGEILVKRFAGKYHVQQIVPGQITLGEQITVRDKAVATNLDILAAKASYNVLELQNGGPLFTPERIRSDVQKALQEKILMRTWNALANIWTTGNASALTISGATYSQFIDAAGPLTSTALDHAIDHVNYWSGGVRAIIGTEAALAPLSTFGQYQIISGANSDNFVAQNGQPALTIQNVSPFGPGPKAVETYRGVTNIVRIKQIFDNSEYPPRPLLPTNYVLVVGEDIGEFITYGDPQTKEFTDMNPTPPYWNYETWLQFGMMIWNARGLVKIAVTSTTP